MIYEFANHKVINAQPTILYNLIKRSEDWPLFIGDCIEVKNTINNEGVYTRYMKSKVRHITCEMKTECVFYDEKFLMEFKQIMQPWPIKSNSGKWYIEKLTENESRMTLIHYVEIKYGFIGDLLMKLFIGKCFISSHADKVLEEFSRYAQGGEIEKY